MIHIAAGAAYQTRQWPNRALYVTYNGQELEVFPIRYEDSPTERWTVDPSLYPDEPGYTGRVRLRPKQHELRRGGQPSAGHAAIEMPSNGSIVSHRCEVSGRCYRLPPDRELWAVVTRPGARFHPQRDKLDVTPEGRFEGMVHIGTPESTGIYQLQLVLVDSADADDFRRYLATARARANFSGLPKLPSSAEILDQIQVARS
jgi:hypothetical protein